MRHAAGYRRASSRWIACMFKWWFGIKFWKRVVAGFVLGALAGWAFGPDAEKWFGPLGDVYVNLIMMIAVPLVFFAVINAVASLAGQQSIAALAGRTFAWFALTAILAVGVGLVAGFVFKPGSELVRCRWPPTTRPRMCQACWTCCSTSCHPIRSRHCPVQRSARMQMA